MAVRVAIAPALPARRRIHQDLRALVVLTSAVAVLASMGYVYLTQASAVSNIGYDISTYEVQEQRLQAHNDQLRMRVAEMRSLAWIEKEASTRLGMGPAERIVYLPALVGAALNPKQIAQNSASGGPSSTQSILAPQAGRVNDSPSLIPFAQRPISH